MVSLIQTTIATVLGPLVAELAASRQTIERHADRVAKLERENGRLAAELVAERARSSLTASTAPQSVGTFTRCPRGWIVGAATLLAIGALGVLLGWSG
jgi:hypothetical protein